eukprot:COSAG02_NODE_2597_length_8456_cov_4.666866_4_plen_64_part_00
MRSARVRRYACKQPYHSGLVGEMVMMTTRAHMHACSMRTKRHHRAQWPRLQQTCVSNRDRARV